MSGFTLAIIGFGIATATAIRWALLLVSVSIPRNRSGFIALMLLGAGLGMTALAIGTQSLVADIAAGLAISAGAFFLFSVAIGKQTGGSGQLQVGSPLADFSAPDENNEPFNISSLRGKPILLKFFRGHW